MTKYELRVVHPCFDACVPLFRRLDDFARGLTQEEGAELYYRMFERGDLLAFRDRDVDQFGDEFGYEFFENLTKIGCLFIPSKQEVAQSLVTEGERSARVMYVLGLRGAQRWEESMRPDWSRFIDVVWGGDAQSDLSDKNIDDGYRIELRGPRSRIEEALTRFFPDGVRIVGTERWAQYSPWHATYWKTLPEAVGVGFRTISHAPRLELEGQWREFATWYHEPADLWDPLPYPPSR